MFEKVLMPSLTDTSFKLQKSFTKRKLLSKMWADQDLYVCTRYVVSRNESQTFWSTWENAHFLCEAH